MVNKDEYIILAAHFVNFVYIYFLGQNVLLSKVNWAYAYADY